MQGDRVKKKNSSVRGPTDEEAKKFVEALEKFGHEQLERIGKEFGTGIVQMLLCARGYILTNKFLGLLIDEVESLEHRIEDIERKLTRLS